MMEQRLFSLQLGKGTLKLSDFWLSHGANMEQDTTDWWSNASNTQLLIMGHSWSRPMSSWVRVPTKAKAGQMIGVAPLLHCRSVSMGTLKLSECLVEYGASKGPRLDRLMEQHLYTQQLRSGASWSCPIFGGVGCQHRQKPNKWWRNASNCCCLSGALWSRPMSGWVRCQQRPRPDRQWSNTSFDGC